MKKTIDVGAVIVSSDKTRKDGRNHWSVKARIFQIISRQPKVNEDTWMSILNLTGTSLNLSYNGPYIPNMSFRSGIVFRLALSITDVEQALEAAARGETPELTVNPEVLRPLSEPCARVPLSILRELRGQEAGIEYSRRALVQAWGEDRKTGDHA